jgi:Flp pilus assembly protein TadG/uncharacterized protein YegL
LLKNLSQKLIDLLKNNQGNFALVAALLLPVLFLAAGISLQYATSTNLKSRLQMAADSASLATVSRIADGGMASDDAEEFAEQIFLAQMSEDIERFDVVDLTPNPVFTETTNGGVTTWTMKIEASASFASTPLLSILGYGNMDVSVLSSATSGNEEVQGALSMGVIVDISGSMYWPIDEAAALQSILGEDRGDASRVSANLYDAFYVYGLSEDQIKFVIGNYDTNDCADVERNNSDRTNFLSAIGEPTSTDSDTAYNYCYGPAYAAEKNGSADELLSKWDQIFPVIAPSKLRNLKDAASTLFDQLTTADPETKYVRTGSAAYRNYLHSTYEMQWGVDGTNAFIESLDADGGTASTDAVDFVLDKLKSSDNTEKSEHLAKNGQIPDRFILLMTDGANNHTSDDTATKQLCDEAKADDVTIFSVAFAGPSKGQELMKYCSSGDAFYFEPETVDSLIIVFELIGTSTAKTLTRLTK